MGEEWVRSGHGVGVEYVGLGVGAITSNARCAALALMRRCPSHSFATLMRSLMVSTSLRRALNPIPSGVEVGSEARYSDAPIASRLERSQLMACGLSPSGTTESKGSWAARRSLYSAA